MPADTPQLPPLKIRFGEITKDNLQQLKVLNLTLFPVRYSDQFYSDILKAQQFAPVTRISVRSGKQVNPIAPQTTGDKDKDSKTYNDDLSKLDANTKQNLAHSAALTKFVYHNDTVIGAVSCRVEDEQQQQSKDSSAEKPKATTGKKRVYIMTLGVLAPYRNRGVGSRLLSHVTDYVQQHSSDFVDIYLHVQSNNDEALQFYKQHHFEQAQRIEGYYKRIQPSDCWLVRRSVESLVADGKQKEETEQNGK